MQSADGVAAGRSKGTGQFRTVGSGRFASDEAARAREMIVGFAGSEGGAQMGGLVGAQMDPVSRFLGGHCEVRREGQPTAGKSC